MLSLIELELLFDILNQVDNTLEGCFGIFNKHFASDFFKPCFVLMQLLNDNVIKKFIYHNFLTIFSF